MVALDRNSEKYRWSVQEAKRINPNMTLGMIEACIIAATGDPECYKRKDTEPIKIPLQSQGSVEIGWAEDSERIMREYEENLERIRQNLGHTPHDVAQSQEEENRYVVPGIEQHDNDELHCV